MTTTTTITSTNTNITTNNTCLSLLMFGCLLAVSKFDGFS